MPGLAGRDAVDTPARVSSVPAFGPPAGRRLASGTGDRGGGADGNRKQRIAKITKGTNMLAQLMKGCLVDETDFELAGSRPIVAGGVAGGIAQFGESAILADGDDGDLALLPSENFANPLCGALAAAKNGEEEEDEEDADEFEDDDEEDEDEEFDGDDEFEDDEDELFEGDDEDEEFDDDLDDEDEEDEDF